jgi:hypothetical protein
LENTPQEKRAARLKPERKQSNHYQSKVTNETNRIGNDKKPVLRKENTRTCTNYLKTIGIGESDNNGREEKNKRRFIYFQEKQ